MQILAGDTTTTTVVHQPAQGRQDPWPAREAGGLVWTDNGRDQVGMMEPITVVALNSPEQAHLIRRVRSRTDRRKVHVVLTAKGRRLRRKWPDC